MDLQQNVFTETEKISNKEGNASHWYRGSKSAFVKGKVWIGNERTEINTDIEKSPGDAVKALGRYYAKIQNTLGKLPEPEFLWSFSNPPYIRNEEDIPVAKFNGKESSKTVYRDYLSD